jgi:hypothetical protein
MKDSETQRQECSETIDYCGIGRELLQSRFERDATDLSARLYALGKIAGEGELGGSEIEELFRLHTQLTETIRLVETYSRFDGNLKTEGFDGGATAE